MSTAGDVVSKSTSTDNATRSGGRAVRPKPKKAMARPTQKAVWNSALFIETVFPFLLSRPRSKMMANKRTIPKVR